MKALRCAAAAFVAVLPQCGAYPAYAVSPPPIDHRRLPQSTPATPTQPTVQREVCAVPSMVRGPDATGSSQLSGLDLPQVWKLTRGSGQRVAVIDTGVSPHPRLLSTSAGGDYVFTGDGAQDCDGHGTAVAGIIAAAADPNHRDDFSGVAPDVQVISIRQSSTKFGPRVDPSTAGVGDVDTMAKAVRTAADLGASVINISSIACILTGSAFDDGALGAALAYAVDTKNAVVVTAAGNSDAGRCPAQDTEVTWETTKVVVSPAWYDEYVLTVGSIGSHGEPSSFTLAGPWVDVAAPGEAVLSLSSAGGGLANAVNGKQGPVPLSGTSYAAPVVSGLAALIRSRFPRMTARQVMQRITATAHHPPGGRDPRVGSGLVDFLAAVSTDPAPSLAVKPPNAAVPVPPPPPPTPPNHRAREMSFTGAAVCGGILAAVLIVSGLHARLRRATADGGNILGD